MKYNGISKLVKTAEKNDKILQQPRGKYAQERNQELEEKLQRHIKKFERKNLKDSNFSEADLAAAFMPYGDIGKKVFGMIRSDMKSSAGKENH